MRGSSCLPLGQTAHRCEGASGPDKAEGECRSPYAMTSFPDSGLPLTPAPFPTRPALICDFISPVNIQVAHSGLFCCHWLNVDQHEVAQLTKSQSHFGITSAATSFFHLAGKLLLKVGFENKCDHRWPKNSLKCKLTQVHCHTVHATQTSDSRRWWHAAIWRVRLTVGVSGGATASVVTGPCSFSPSLSDDDIQLSHSSVPAL